MITIIDYGLGNLASIKNMIKKVGGKSEITADPEKIAAAEKLILPGVGHFAKGMESLNASGLVDVLNRKVKEEKCPVMGICLGMQLMTEYSEEGDCPGLGWIPAKTTKFTFEDKSIKVPHMGWNEVQVQQEQWLEGYQETPRFYFVHSYFVTCTDPSTSLVKAQYGHEFDAGFQKDNVIGVQFHPEKSHKFGMHWMKKFIEL